MTREAVYIKADTCWSSGDSAARLLSLSYSVRSFSAKMSGHWLTIQMLAHPHTHTHTHTHTHLTDMFSSLENCHSEGTQRHRFTHRKRNIIDRKSVVSRKRIYT